MKIPINKATVVIQGFGNVGSEAATALSNYGAKIIAISDYTGGIHNPDGLEIQPPDSSETPERRRARGLDQLTRIASAPVSST